MKEFVKQFIPVPLLNLYHLTLAHLAPLFYGHPSKDLVVIGVTGTKGKTTTANLISRILEEAGFKTGISSTLNFKIAGKEWLSDLKMTMPGRFYLQKLLREMVRAGCRFAVIETSSEGIAQHRHVGIWYDALVFANLTPEHLEAHGGFDNYKQIKLKLFEHLAKLPQKFLAGRSIPKVIVANSDDHHARDFLNFAVDKKITYGVKTNANFQAKEVNIGQTGVGFKLHGSSFMLKLLGQFDVYNCLAAIAATSAFEASLNIAKQALEKIPGIPGRLEVVPNDQGLIIVVDYAYEPESLRQVYETISHWPHQRMIHVLGPTGGGRDQWRRPVMGEMAGKRADIAVITTDDPYDEDRMRIIEEMAAGVLKVGKKLNEDLYLEKDRRKAIAKALSLAQKNDLVLITGKGAEQVMAVGGGKKIPWDDRRVVREELSKLRGDLFRSAFGRTTLPPPERRRRAGRPGEGLGERSKY